MYAGHGHRRYTDIALHTPTLRLPSPYPSQQRAYQSPARLGHNGSGDVFCFSLCLSINPCLAAVVVKQSRNHTWPAKLWPNNIILAFTHTRPVTEASAMNNAASACVGVLLGRSAFNEWMNEHDSQRPQADDTWLWRAINQGRVGWIFARLCQVAFSLFSVHLRLNPPLFRVRWMLGPLAAACWRQRRGAAEALFALLGWECARCSGTASQQRERPFTC